MELLTVKTNENRNMEKNSIFNKNAIIAFIIGIVVGFGGTWFIMRAPVVTDNTSSDAGTEEINEASDVVLSGQNVILVRDQEAGINVEIELVTLENIGWVVIHEDNDGAFGNALGAQLFDFGSTNNGIVELLRGTEAGKTYFATIRQDDGDRAFDLTKDILLSDSEGNPIQIKFKVTEALVE